MEKMSVDVIIPTYHPGEAFVELLRRLSRQTYPIQRIHIINTETEAFPEEICRRYDCIDLTHIPQDAFDHGATRDMGAAASHADILLFMTQDAVPADTRLIEELVRPFEDARVGVSYARQIPNKHCHVIERYTRSFNYPKESQVKSKSDLKTLGIKTFFCSNVCAAYRKSAYDALGGFVKHTIFNEDMIMAGRMIQAGFHVAYTASARVIHSHNYGCREQFKRNFDLAVSQTDYPEVFAGLPSEKEGMKLVKQTACYLWRVKKPWLIFSLILKSGYKYAGYQMGRHYRCLPRGLVLRCSMNPRYWSA